jgi:hypothetical protein
MSRVTTGNGRFFSFSACTIGWKNMHRNKIGGSILRMARFILFGLIVFLVLTIPHLGHATMPFNVKTGHPRIYLDQTRVEEIRAAKKEAAPFCNSKYSISPGSKNILASGWCYFYGSASNFAAQLNTGSLVLELSSAHPNTIIYIARVLGLASLVTGEERFKTAALKYADRLVATSPSAGGDYPQAGRIEAMGTLYDWLFDLMNSTQISSGGMSYREALGSAIKATIRFREDDICGAKGKVTENWNCSATTTKPDFISGHSHQNNSEIAAGLLAIIDEYPELVPLLVAVYRNFVEGFNPAREWISIDGGHHMGWAYGAGYSFLDPILLWTKATDVKMIADWQSKLIYPYIYGLRGDMTYPSSGDAFPVGPDRDLVSGFALWSALHFSDPYAGNFYNSWVAKKGYRFSDFVYWKPGFPETSIEALPYSRLFRNSGQALMRDTWDYPNATLLEFKSSSFGSLNHHHLDQNSFTIFYRSPLLLDSGYYDLYGTNHWYNYYIRTIAHNSIAVWDPNEKFLRSGAPKELQPFSNDGGQSLMKNTHPNLEQIKEGGSNHLDGIIRYEYTSEYTYASGNASKAYNPDKLDQQNGFVRSILFLRKPPFWEHPIFVVFDSVKTAPGKAGLKKSFLLHTATEPEPFGGEKTGPGQFRTSNKIFTIRNGRGMLFAETVLPEEATIMKIGGRDAGGDYRFLVPNGNVVLTNYPPDPTKVNPGQPIKGAQLIAAAPDVGSWRIEVSPAVSSQQDFFLHLLSVADNIPSLKPPAARNLTSKTAAAVLIEGRQLIAFNKGEQPASTLSWEMPQRNADLIIVGLLADTNYSMSVIPNKSEKMPYTVVVERDPKGPHKTSVQGVLRVSAKD